MISHRLTVEGPASMRLDVDRAAPPVGVESVDETGRVGGEAVKA